MKKNLFLLASVFTFGISVASASNDKVIGKSELPSAAQDFINEHFDGAKLSYAKLETDFLFRSYEVVLENGTRLEFSSKGEWEDVDCRKCEVPVALVPASIKEYVNANYAGEKVLQIERDSRGYEIKLSNGLELKFNNDFVIVDIDD